MVSSTPRHFTPGKDPVPILQEAEWAPGLVWTGGKSHPHRNSIPDRPARNSVAITTELPDPQPTMKVLSYILGRLNHISHNTSIVDGQARLSKNWTRIDDNISTNAKEGRFFA